MATENFFLIYHGIRSLLQDETQHKVEPAMVEARAEHAFLWMKIKHRYRVELNHNYVNGRSTLKVRFYSGHTGTKRVLDPRIKHLNDAGDVKWFHYASSACAETSVYFDEGIKQSIEKVVTFLMAAATIADQVI